LNQLTSGLIGQGKVVFQLSNTGTGNPVGVPGTSVLPQLTYTAVSSNNGTFSISLWGNDVINPANTLYSVTFFDYSGNSMGPVLYSIIGTTANLNTLAVVSMSIPPVFVTSGNLAFNNSSQNANFSVVALATVYRVTTGGSTITCTLPTAVGIPGQTVIVKKIDAGAGTVVVTPTGGQTIDGLATFTLSAQYQYIGMESDGANWSIFTRN
jgi:hypothetical protein